jgi:malonyl-CoA decarboxylase
MDRMAHVVSPLLDANIASRDPGRATTAVFYSISNCQPGLRGVSLGNFLIKHVVEVLSREFPRLTVFCTLSPVPGFAAWLVPMLGGADARTPKVMSKALKGVATVLGSDLAGLIGNADDVVARLAPLEEPLLRLCATYLLHPAAAGEPAQDLVARFHLDNGAKLDRINWLADPSRKGLRESLGMMVNYLYEPRAIEENHEKFVQGEIVASRRVRALKLVD